MNLNILFAFSTCFCRQIFEFTFYDYFFVCVQKIVVKRYIEFDRIRFERIENCISSTHEKHMFFEVSIFLLPLAMLCAFISSLFLYMIFFLFDLTFMMSFGGKSFCEAIKLSSFYHHTQKSFQFTWCNLIGDKNWVPTLAI